MKSTRVCLMWVIVSIAECSFALYGASQDLFLSTVAKAQVAGVGIYSGQEGGTSTICNIHYWLGELSTNALLLTNTFEDGVFAPTVELGDCVVFFATTNGWNSIPTNIAFRSIPKLSAWELREKLRLAGPSDIAPTNPTTWRGTWIRVPTNAPAVPGFSSNVVHTLCVAPNLFQYTRALAPAVHAAEVDDLFMFKSDAWMELLKLAWSESETNLVEVLYDPGQPKKIRGSYLFQLKQRFGWPATNTVPEL